MLKQVANHYAINVRNFSSHDINEYQQLDKFVCF